MTTVPPQFSSAEVAQAKPRCSCPTGGRNRVADLPRPIRLRRIAAAHCVGCRRRRHRDWVQWTTAITALGALLFAGVSARQAQDQLRVAADGQISDRFSKAIEQLGAIDLDVRLGGLYALERLARTSPPNQATIVEVLSAFVRDHVRRQLTPTHARPSLYQVATDVSVALTVLGRRDRTRDGGARATFQRTDFTQLDLPDIDFAGADFARANLTGAHLTGVNLSYATLTRTRMVGVNLTAANLAHADLAYADLRGARLTAVDFTGTCLIGARLPNR
jgi:hypothetical protein